LHGLRVASVGCLFVIRRDITALFVQIGQGAHTISIAGIGGFLEIFAGLLVVRAPILLREKVTQIVITPPISLVGGFLVPQVLNPKIPAKAARGTNKIATILTQPINRLATCSVMSVSEAF
jgi:hypothetical protein